MGFSWFKIYSQVPTSLCDVGTERVESVYKVKGAEDNSFVCFTNTVPFIDTKNVNNSPIYLAVNSQTVPNYLYMK